ncbi:MAG: T9SS type A sorting domain-containing protein, partial [Chitinophagales bacterium]|nr:T9SS type A sorting domain-containing protein [Chitinophagales bacterium]
AYCNSTSSSISLTINSSPNVNITPSGTITECKGVKITFTSTAVAGNTYQWLKGGVAISGGTTSTYTTSQNESGHYSVKITSSNGCSATSNETILNRLNQPTATITAIGNLDICIAGSVTLQASSGSGYTYQWKKDGAKISGATNITYTATSAGSYKIKITNTDGCSKTSAATNVTKSCRLINEENNISEKVISIHPVPNDGNFEVVFHNFMRGSEGAIMVRDLLGKIIFSESIGINSNVFNKHISLGNQLPDGIYFVEFMSEGYKNIQKITIVK